MFAPLTYSKEAQKKKPNKELRQIFEKNFNQLNHPIRCADGPVVKWPLKAVEGQPFFYGYLNKQAGQVEIYDDGALLMLNWLGNYGKCHFLDGLLISCKSNLFNRVRVYEKLKKEESLRQTERAQSSNSLGFLSNPSNLFELNQDNYRRNLHADALNGLFAAPNESHVSELLDRLYKRPFKERPDKSVAREDPAQKKQQSNSFEDTFVQLKASFNQNFIDREEYVLRLDLEEALFLKHAFGILSVQEFVRDSDASESNGRPPTTNLSLAQLWTRCVRLAADQNECFATKYAAYFYFRSKGFIVKSGTKFGSDFVLYSRNPMFVHSCYSVLLLKRPADDERQALKFANVQAFMRMTKCVVKVRLLISFSARSNVTG